MIQTNTEKDFILYGENFGSRFLLGTALYASPSIMRNSIIQSRCEIVTLGLRRQNPADRSGDAITSYFLYSLASGTEHRILVFEDRSWFSFCGCCDEVDWEAFCVTRYRLRQTLA